MTIIKKTNTDKKYSGCDSVVFISNKRHGEPIRLLQLTDMQFIDSTQARVADRLRSDEKEAWLPQNFDALCGNQIRSLVTQARPDIIFITGDMVYGEFDDNGRVFEYFCALMESFGIPWAPVFGNHDNESRMGVDWQTKMLEEAPHCLFRRGNVSGNGNYTFGIAKDGELIRVMHMLDTNGARSSDSSILPRGIYKDQIELINANSDLIAEESGKIIPSFLAYHIPTEHFKKCAAEKGYSKDGSFTFNIGVDVASCDGDFGYCDENTSFIKTDDSFDEMLEHAHVDGVFVGHLHKVNTCITSHGIKWVYGLKTGQYDYHVLGQTGGTLVSLYDYGFEVQHIPSLTRLAPYPAGAPLLKNIST